MPRARINAKLAALERSHAARLSAAATPSAREWTLLFAARDPGNAALLAGSREAALSCAPLLGGDGPHWHAGHAVLALVYASGVAYDAEPPAPTADPTPAQSRAGAMLGELVARLRAFACETGLPRSIPMLDLGSAPGAPVTGDAP